MQEKAVVELGTLHFKEANELVREALAAADLVELRNVYAQRYLGCTMPRGKRLEIHGVPGNDMACYMDGGEIEVFGNAQDQVGNTMDNGLIVIHGRCGDAAGYAMRGGKLLIRDGCGWRVGINMKQYQDKYPWIVIGGDAGNFLGEYMAGGVIVLLGHAGEYLATGMTGGVIYLRENISPELLPAGATIQQVSEEEAAELQEILSLYNHYFASELQELGRPLAPQDARGFYALRPKGEAPGNTTYID